MTKGMRAPSTKTGFLLLLLAEDRLARLLPLLAAAAAAREATVAARADRIVVITPGCIMARLCSLSPGKAKIKQQSVFVATNNAGAEQGLENGGGCVRTFSPLVAAPLFRCHVSLGGAELVTILLDDSG